ncbi:MAG: lamin tail domain-containing protein [Phycisphaerales bacterium]|nr:lamin tail domain-containing protein [Phycisphaerales bacterium]
MRIHSLRLCSTVALGLGVTATALAASDLVISQVYGGGGNTGATYNRDFIEIFNRGASAIELSGKSVQYASATGTSWQAAQIGTRVHFSLVLAKGM